MGAVLKALDIIEAPGKGLARRSPKKGAKGLALINATVADIAQPLTIADQCRSPGIDTYLADDVADGDFTVSCIDRASLLKQAKRVRTHLLRDLADVKAAHNSLFRVTFASEKVSYEIAVGMLSALYGALSKKKSDDENSGALMEASADLFNPVTDVVGRASGLWKPVSKHPAILALAIKRLLATQVFTPSPSELIEAMKHVEDRLGCLEHYANQWLESLYRADDIVFTFDRPAWEAAYANVSSKIVRMMQERLCGEEPGEDDDGNPIAPSQRWQALDDLIKAKEAPQRVAACKKSPAKRTHKAKRAMEEEPAS